MEGEEKRWQDKNEVMKMRRGEEEKAREKDRGARKGEARREEKGREKEGRKEGM